MAEACAAVDAAGGLSFASGMRGIVVIGIVTAVCLFVDVFVVVVFFLFCGVDMVAPVHLLRYAGAVTAMLRIAAVRHGYRAGSGYREKGDKHDHKVSFKDAHTQILAQPGIIARFFCRTDSARIKACIDTDVTKVCVKVLLLKK